MLCQQSIEGSPINYSAALLTATPPSKLLKAYWRLDVTDDQLGVVVVHVAQKVLMNLVFIGCKPSEDQRSVLATVDLPDDLVFKAGSDTSKPGIISKWFGTGKNLIEKQLNMNLTKLQRSRVLDASGKQVPGFPNIVVELPHDMCPSSKNLSVPAECHQAWRQLKICYTHKQMMQVLTSMST